MKAVTVQKAATVGALRTKRSVLIASLFLSSGIALSQQVEKDPAAVVELGVAPGWNLKDGGFSVGPTVAVEITPIENWLELEAGVTPSFAHHSTEWDTDLLFKKPWTLSKRSSSCSALVRYGFTRTNKA